ncbi:MAG: CoA activase, partial [Eggerthellaceae bacterium]|nr:CoA activase [Eggerthellaceae bacterium]
MMQESEVHIQSSDCESAGSQIANDACNLHERPSTTEPLAAGMGSEALMVGIDVGSTTVKAVVLDASSRTTLHATYRRHHAHQLDTVRIVLSELSSKFGDNPMRFALTGSGASEIARFAQACYVQEVVANAIAVQDEYPQVRCAIELGGQDAKMVFFEPDAVTGALSVSDMRMNGSCAGGTGAFLDEIASLLKVPVEQLNQCAARGTTLYSISGRCGVYAKTDIQPLINQGVTKEDIALSTFHAVAKQTLGGLAQGLDVRPPVIFEGGPLTFNPKLVDVFVERLKLEDGEAVVPRSPETIVARGAALSLAGMYAEEGIACSATDVLERLKDVDAAIAGESSSAAPFFETPEQVEQFKARHALHVMPLGVSAFSPGQEVNV